MDYGSLDGGDILDVFFEGGRVVGFQAISGPVCIDGGTGVTQKGGNLFRGVNPKANQCVYPKFRRQDTLNGHKMRDIRAEKFVQVGDEGREQGQEGAVEYIVEGFPFLFNYGIGFQFFGQGFEFTRESLAV